MDLNYQNLQCFTRCCNYRPMVDWKYVETTLDRWCNKYDGLCKLNLDPEFQRLHVWTLDQQIKYVEYILQGGQSGRDIYFNCKGWQGSYSGPFVIVDGKQRLQAVRQFLANKVPIFDGHYHKDFSGFLPPQASFYFNVNDLKTDAEVIKWYLEMNTGGTPHTAEEIQKAKNLLEKCK